MKSSPTEILYWEVLPAIRKEIVFQMHNELLIRQVEIARVLELTPSAVSQYLNSKRASQFEFSEYFKKEIKSSAQRIYSKEKGAFEETTRLIKFFENSRELCEVCKGKNDLSHSCSVCFDSKEKS
jgi:hypothetical protein